ncbi:MAG: hypothetical protein HUU56_00135 [Bdellovibrionaceae bacterium]|nr:hypothetical protein [Pseudobdellovibrionaceae bacterium]
MQTTELIHKSSLKCLFQIHPRWEENKKPSVLLNIAIDQVGFTIQSDDENYFHFKNNPTQDSTKNTKIFSHFFPNLTFVDLIMVLEFLELHKSVIFTPDELFKAYQIPFHQRYRSLATEILALENKNLLAWISEKKVKPQELIFLFNLNSRDREKILNVATNSLLSKTQTLQYMEWLTDLQLLKCDLNNSFYEKVNESKLEELKNQRFPNSFLKHPLLEKKITWGNQIQAQFVRKNDRAGFQIQTFVSSPEELAKTITQLNKSLENWTSNPNDCEALK